MARKPKASSSPDLTTTEAGDNLAAAGGLLGARRRGRKPRTAVIMPAPFSAMEDNGAATGSAPANADATGANDTERRGRGGRKPKQAADQGFRTKNSVVTVCLRGVA